jgi:hypothetical protein
MWIIADHKESDNYKRKKEKTYRQKEKGKESDRLVYFTSVLAVLVDGTGFGLKKSRIFFEWGLAAFTKVFHFSLFIPVGLPAFAQSTFC